MYTSVQKKLMPRHSAQIESKLSWKNIFCPRLKSSYSIVNRMENDFLATDKIFCPRQNLLCSANCDFVTCKNDFVQANDEALGSMFGSFYWSIFFNVNCMSPWRSL